jgi:hypothetical protein
MNNIQWDAPFKVNTTDTIDGVSKLLIKGVLIDQTKNLNNWVVEPEDFEIVGKSFIGKQIRSDHSEKIENVLGKIISTELDGPHSEAKDAWDPATPYEHLHFVGEISSKNSEVILPIQMGYISHISPAIDARSILCALCRKPMVDKNIKTCGCEDSGVLLKDMTAREVSLVCSPAYAGTVFKPYSFVAAVDGEFLSEDKILEIVTDELTKRGIE